MKLLQTMACMLALCALTLCGSARPASAAAKEVKLLFPEPYSSASSYAEGQAVGIYYGALDFNMQNHPALRGKYKMRWVGDVVKSPADAINAVATGAGQFTYTLPQFIEQFDPDWRVITAPGVFKDMAHFLRAMDTPAWKAKQESLAETKGFRILKWTNSIGHFWIWTKNGPADSLAAMKNQKIRYSGQQSYANAFKALGLVGVALPYTEVVSALQTNMIEGLTNDIFGYTYYDLPRQTRYMLPVPLGFCPQALVVNRKWWDSLPESERKALEFVIAATDVHQYFEDEEQRILKWWDENPDTILVKMIPEARAEWEAALRQATGEFDKGVDRPRPARPPQCGGKGKSHVTTQPCRGQTQAPLDRILGSGLLCGHSCQFRGNRLPHPFPFFHRPHVRPACLADHLGRHDGGRAHSARRRPRFSGHAPQRPARARPQGLRYHQLLRHHRVRRGHQLERLCLHFPMH